MPRKSKKQIEEELIQERKSKRIAWIIIGILSALVLVFALAKMGDFGRILNNVLTFIFGSLYVIPLITLFIYAIKTVFFTKEDDRHIRLILGLNLTNIFIILLTSFIAKDVNDFTELSSYIKGNFWPIFNGDPFSFTGGIFGSLLYALFNRLVSRSGIILILVAMCIVSLILLIPGETYKQMFDNTKASIADSKKQRQEAKALKLQQEQERKARQAEQMAAQAEKEALEEMEAASKQEEIIEEALEVKQVKKVDTYSTNSPFLINLSEDELAQTDFVEKKSSSHANTKTTTSSNIDFVEVKEDGTQAVKHKIHKVVRNNGSYKLPKPYDAFLETSTSNSSNVNKTSAAVKGQKVIEILKNFDIDSTLINTYIGPSVTKFEIKPVSTVKINKIYNISDNIKMELAARDIRIEAPIPGRSAVGIEIPNVEPIPVKMLDLIKSLPASKKESLLFCLGKDLMGKPVYCDVAKMPHLLIAGATGSGKSVCINSIITSFLLRTNPDDVKLVLVDPKKVEFTPYKDIPHLLWPIIDDAQMASNMLKRMVVMMEDRYDAFATAGVRNIDAFNQYVEENNAQLKPGESPIQKMPYIVIIIDELADLMSIARKDVELSIQRITQLARASGIHLIVATQRPSTDVITGLIKSNIPSRISFAVASSIDSRTVLDATGAERLLGNGDMLYHPQGENAPMRLQGVFVTDNEIRKLTKFVKDQAKPNYEDSYYEFMTNMTGTTVMGAGSVNADTMDSLYDEVVEFVRSQQKASTSLLQRRFGIGYNRAARLIDTLEDKGIIGPQNGSKPRDVYIKQDEE